MACFDYKCKECGHKIEDVIEPWVAAPAPRNCPACNKEGSAIRLDFYNTTFQYIGIGWNSSSANCNNFKV